MTDHKVVSRAEWQAGRDEGAGFQTRIRRHHEYA